MVLSPCKSGPRFVLFCLLGPPASTSTNLADSRRWSQSHHQRLCVVFSTLDLIAGMYMSSPESLSLPPCLRAASSTKFLQARHKLFLFCLCISVETWLCHNTHTLSLTHSVLSCYPPVSCLITSIIPSSLHEYAFSWALPRYQKPVVAYYGSCFR